MILMTNDAEFPTTWHDFAASLLPAFLTWLALVLQVIGWPLHEKTPVATKAFVLFVVLLVSVALQYAWFRGQTIDRHRRHKRQVLDKTLDRFLGQVADPGGNLDARMNVMKPHRNPRAVLDSRAPYWFMRSKLYPIACSANLKGSPEAGLPWSRGNGCVGLLWQRGAQYAVARIEDEDDIVEWRLSPTQRDLTRSMKCVISVAVFKEIGIQQRLLGFINLDAAANAAAQAWLTEGDEIRPALQEMLIALARYIAAEGLLD